MPELPEVETVARSLAPHVKDSLILSANLLHKPTMHELSLPFSSLENCRIVNARRRAKLLMLDLIPPNPEGPTLLVAHLRMTGRLFTPDANAELGKHTRCIFTLQTPKGEKQQMFFDDARTFGKLMAANEDILQKWPFWQSLGPEPFDLTAETFTKRLQSNRPIKTALLDQATIAGLGNIYADEALFKAGINPKRLAKSLSSAEIERLLSSLQAILMDAIAKKGSSIRDYRDANGNAGTFQESFMVYGRGGQTCRLCGEELQKIRIAGRSSVFCGKCQS